MGNIRGLAFAWALTAAGAAMAAVVGEASFMGEIDTTKKVADVPTRVVVAGNLMFALETGASRIMVTNLATSAAARYYGVTNASSGAGVNYTDSSAACTKIGNKVIWAQGSGNGGFRQPRGLAFGSSGVANRLAVADTGNNRVQLFTFNKNTGALTFVSAYEGSGANALNEPEAVAFMGGDLLVADTGNHRVLRLRYGTSSGNWTQIAKYDFGENDIIHGVCYGSDTEEGFWVARGYGQTQCVSFHHFSGFSANQPVVALGTPFTNDIFDEPTDVQAWAVDGWTLVVVADSNNSRALILNAVPGASGAFARLSVVADVGNGKDYSLDNEEQLSGPCGVFPVQGDEVLYVADTGHNMVKRYGLAFTEVEDPEVIGPPEAWNISSFKIVDGGATARIGWKVPDTADGQTPTGEDFKFLLYFNASLSDVAQVDGASFQPEDANVTVGQSEEGGSIHEEDFPLGDVGNPASGFFRLWWLNKVVQ